MAEPIDEWDRQDKEGAKAFEAFACYRDMGATRSVRKVAQELGKSCTLIAKWSKRWSWGSRTVAYDRYLDRTFRESIREGVRETAMKLQTSRAQLADILLEATSLMDSSALPSRETIRLFDVLTRSQRPDLELIFSNQSSPSPDELDEFDVENMTDEERRDLMQQIRDEADRALGEYGVGGPKDVDWDDDDA